jgi:hypothetical protein
LELLAGVENAANEKAPGLFLGGNYKTGVAFGDCIQYGADIAKTALEMLSSEKSIAESSQPAIVTTSA